MSLEVHPSAAGTGKRSRRRPHAPLTHRVVVAAALAYIDEHGVVDLTMRRLGDSLNVEAMALYRYVGGKRDLLNDVAVSLVESIDIDVNQSVVPEGEWQDVVRRMANSVRRTALAHPGAFPLVVSCPPEAAWLRPPLIRLDGVESFMRCLREGGLRDDACVLTYRALTSLLMGHLLMEAIQCGKENDGRIVSHSIVKGDGCATHPVLKSLHPRLSEHRFALEFEAATEALIDHVAFSL